VNGRARAFALAGAGLLLSGCAPRPCVVAANAAIAFDAACASAGLEKSDPELLLACGVNYSRVRAALLASQCRAELEEPKP
jgi:hypothetical protein